MFITEDIDTGLQASRPNSFGYRISKAAWRWLRL